MAPPPRPQLRITDPADVARAVRDRRRALGIRQEDLALSAGTGRRFVIDLEAGKPTARLGQTLAVLRALGLEVRIDTGEAAPDADA